MGSKRGVLVLVVMFFLSGMAVAEGDAIENGEEENQVLLEEKIEVVRELLAERKQALRPALSSFYSGVVRCYRAFPKQARNHAGFTPCLKGLAKTFAARFPKAVSQRVLQLSRREIALDRRPLPERSIPPTEKAYYKHLDDTLLSLSKGKVGVTHLGAGLVIDEYDCIEHTLREIARRPETDFRTCAYYAAWDNISAIYEVVGVPGATGDASDLSVTPKEKPRNTYVARFNDYGGYYKFPQSKEAKGMGLPPGQHVNKNIPKLEEPDLWRPTGHKFLDRMMNKVIGDMLVGKAIFGNYQKVFGP